MSQTRPIPNPAWRRPPVLARNPAQAMRQAVLDALLRGAAGPAGADGNAPRLLVAPAASATAPAQLAAAQSLDAAERQKLAASHEQCLRVFRNLARGQAPDTEDDDLGAALAFFTAVNLHALHGVDVEREVMAVLERQLLGVSRRASNWDAASLAQRQVFFERIAILSIVVSSACASAPAQGPAAVARLRQAARQYLQELLGLNPDLLSLGPRGLVTRDGAAPARTGAARRPS